MLPATCPTTICSNSSQRLTKSRPNNWQIGVKLQHTKCVNQCSNLSSSSWNLKLIDSLSPLHKTKLWALENSPHCKKCVWMITRSANNNHHLKWQLISHDQAANTWAPRCKMLQFSHSARLKVEPLVKECLVTLLKVAYCLFLLLILHWISKVQ